MQVIVISESLIIRKGIIQILSGENCVSGVSESHLCSDIYKDKYDLIIADLKKTNESYIKELQNIKSSTDAKVMVLDFYEDGSLFAKCMKAGVDGYILANIDSEDIAYAVKQIFKGKKYYDSDLIENYISKSENKCIEELTKREQEILICIAKGKTNMEISKELYITEHTVKKHTSNIFAKLNLKDRMQAAIYAYNRGIVSI